MPPLLVIEDDSAVRATLVELLKTDGFKVLAAENGLMGVSLAQTYLPDLIICDVMMPGLDGYDVLTTLRQAPATASIPFIFLTGRADRADVRRGMNIGADDYLTKPFTRAEVREAITSRLQRRTAFVQPYIEELQHAADQQLYYDSLTGLPNRLLLREQFDRIVMRARAGAWIPIVSLNLDRFTRIPATLGRDAGDAILQAVAERLQADQAHPRAIARLQADQFAFILAPVRTLAEAESQANALLELIRQPFTLGTDTIFLTASLGVALYPRDGQDLDDLMRAADAALGHVHERGGNAVAFYVAEHHTCSATQLALESDLYQALEQDEFRMYYQPRVSLRSGTIVGAEALLRWQHPQRGIVSPADFIPLAEATGLIVPLGEWVVQTVCAQLQDWQRAGMPPLSVSVNLSGRQLTLPELPERLTDIVQAYCFAPQALEFEVTESLVMRDIPLAGTALTALREAGMRIAIDDFGTGYSSLSYLQQLPLDILKIDRAFVRQVAPGSDNAAIVTAIIQMAHSLHLQVVAEGVEEQSEALFLRQHQCDEIQGYWCSRPVPAGAFETLLTASRSWLSEL
jgi:diguanylate cyclase (GGDEF)-like protein